MACTDLSGGLGCPIMRFPSPLIRGVLIRRYKRFLADVDLDGAGVVTVHCPNPGAMMGLDTPGSEVWVSKSSNPARKLAHTLELVRVSPGLDGLVGINTGHPNRIAEESIIAGLIPELAGYAHLRREVKYGRNSRIDLLLEDSHRPPVYVEVKNVHLRRPDRFGGGAAEFPDSVTVRGAKHLSELSDMVRQGYRAVMLYLVQRADCDHFRIAEDIDPVYATALDRARDAGVEVLCYACAVSVETIELDRPLDLRIRQSADALPA